MTALAAVLSKLARAAVAYARQGWKVFPVKPRAKEPLIPTGFHGASCDPVTVTGWWTRWPDANIGTSPGSCGYVVLDLDGPAGVTTAERLSLLEEPTLEVVTGRDDGGRHRWYTHPGGQIRNGRLGDHLDVRGDAGYVLLPPSVHPSGRAYRWQGRLEEVAALPPRIVEALRGQSVSDFAPDQGDKLPAWMLPYLDAPPGKRNDSMARFVGWAFQQGHDEGTVKVMTHGLNASWTAPLPKDEVDAVVKSIGAKERQKPRRVTDTGRELTIAQQAPPPKPFAEIGWEQVDGAIERGQRDYSAAPRWRWADLDALTGPLLPRDLYIVGALTGNGKTSYLLSQMDRWVEQRIPVLYVPLELDPEDLRRQWAAWECGLPWEQVAANAWTDLPTGARERHEQALVKQLRHSLVHFPPDRRINLPQLVEYVKRSVEEFQVQIVVIDHFHRMNFGGASAHYRIQVQEAARELKDLARSFGVVVVASAQLNTDPHPLDRYYPPVLKRLKESSGLGEEANVVLMLSRRLREAPSPDKLVAIRSGHIEIRDLEEPSLMVVTCRKSRLKDSARDRAVYLNVVNGRVTDRLSRWSGATP